MSVRLSNTPSTTTQQLSAANIQVRTQRALEIEKIFNQTRPGERLANATEYLDRVGLLMQRALQDRDELYKTGIKSTSQIAAARQALNEHIQVLQRVLQAAKSANILSDKREAATGVPWAGKLAKEESPLHWAVQNHNYPLALAMRLEMRQNRLAFLCQKYTETVVKNSKIAAILKKPNVLPALIQALEVLHLLSYRDLKGEELKSLVKDPDILKVVQDPNFLKFQSSPKVLTVLNNQDILFDVDANGVSPLHEAFLQKDQRMVRVLLFPQLVANPTLNQIFWSRNTELQTRINKMRHVDPSTLSPTCRAAYFGDTEHLSVAADIDQSDEKGLRPLHYAILGGQIESIQYLLPKCKLYPRTNKEPSFLDYAILSGHADLYAAFKNKRLNSPFRLGKEREEFNYLVASGVLNQQLTATARVKDPLAMGGMDQSLFGFINLNAVWTGAKVLNWTGAKVFNWAIGTPDPTAGWLQWAANAAGRIGNSAGHGIEDLASALNRHWTGRQQVLNILPNWAKTANEIYGTAGLVFCFLSPFIPYLGQGVEKVAAWMKITLPTIDQNAQNKLSTTMDTIAKGYTLLRIAGAAVPVIKRIPVYMHAFKSRPKDVMKRFATDLFNVTTQAWMGYDLHYTQTT